MFTYYKMLTISVAFFTTAILNIPKVENSPKNGFFSEFRQISRFWGYLQLNARVAPNHRLASRLEGFLGRNDGQGLLFGAGNPRIEDLPVQQRMPFARRQEHHDIRVTRALRLVNGYRKSSLNGVARQH